MKNIGTKIVKKILLSKYLKVNKIITINILQENLNLKLI
jgi:hypothetical protein